MKTRRSVLVVCIVSALLLVNSLSAFAAPSLPASSVASATPAALPALSGTIDFSAYGRPLSPAEMEATEGEWSKVALGVLGGVASAVIEYYVSDDTPSLPELADAVVDGIISGVVTGSIGVGIDAAPGVEYAMTAADLAWAAISGACVGVIEGVREAFGW